MPSSRPSRSSHRSRTSSTSTSGTAPEPAADLGVNLAVVCGPCSGPPELRVLQSGTRLATLAVRGPAGPAGDERATSVPVTVWQPPAWVDRLEAGDLVIVVGRMRRRFYQRAGGVGSRVDLEADLIGRARDRRRVDAALRKAYGALEPLG